MRPENERGVYFSFNRRNLVFREMLKKSSSSFCFVLSFPIQVNVSLFLSVCHTRYGVDLLLSIVLRLVKSVSIHNEYNKTTGLGISEVPPR